MSWKKIHHKQNQILFSVQVKGNVGEFNMSHFDSLPSVRCLRYICFWMVMRPMIVGGIPFHWNLLSHQSLFFGDRMEQFLLSKESMIWLFSWKKVHSAVLPYLLPLLRFLKFRAREGWPKKIRGSSSIYDMSIQRWR